MRGPLAAAILLLAPAWAGCNLLLPFDLGALPRRDAGSDGDADGDTDGDTDGEADGDVGPALAPGPLVLVGTVSMVSEPVCDVDGDGSLDNALAALGGESAELFAFAMSTALDGASSAGWYPMVHFGWLDDPTSPSSEGTTVAVYGGIEVDSPADPSDDRSGQEPFFTSSAALDPCGEPRHVVEDVRVEEGAVSGGSGIVALFFGGEQVELGIAELSGDLAPRGESFMLRACGMVSVRDLGAVSGRFAAMGDLSILEVFLSGGAAFGVDSVPGISPDVDLDGDGLEAFILDDALHITSCIDGDRAVIEGRDCWQNPRIVDAFSLTFQLEGTSARYAGREPGWEYMVPMGCEAFPAPSSFFSTIPPTDTLCAALGEPCDPLARTPCCDGIHRCSGGDLESYRCSAPCTPSQCDYGDLRGSCILQGGFPAPMCWPLGDALGISDCTPSEWGCTTEYGVSEDTYCFDFEGESFCIETCAAPAAPCGEDRRCVPNPFEPGGVCVYEPWVHWH